MVGDFRTVPGHHYPQAIQAQSNLAFPPADVFANDPCPGDPFFTSNLMRLLQPVVFLVLILPAAPSTAGPQTGGVTGVIPLPARPHGRIAVEKYTGTISGKVGAPPPLRAGVWIEGAGIAAGTPPPRVVLSQKDYQFAQSLLVVSRGTSVEFPNNDNDYHNIYSLSRAKRFDVGRYKKSDAPAPVVTFDTVGFVRLQCEIHDHMKAAVLVVSSPHFTVTDAAGKFTLTGLPPGSYTLRAQLDEKTQWSMPVTITSGKAAAVDFQKPAPSP
jgi:plastocyanin